MTTAEVRFESQEFVPFDHKAQEIAKKVEAEIKAWQKLFRGFIYLMTWIRDGHDGNLQQLKSDRISDLKSQEELDAYHRFQHGHDYEKLLEYPMALDDTSDYELRKFAGQVMQQINQLSHLELENPEMSVQDVIDEAQTRALL